MKTVIINPVDLQGLAAVGRHVGPMDPIQWIFQKYMYMFDVATIYLQMQNI